MMGQLKTSLRAIVILIALGFLLPMRGQNTTSTSSTVHIYTIKGVRVGIDTDGTSWQTILWVLNTYAGDQNVVTVQLMDTSGTTAVETNWTFDSGQSTQNGAWVHGQLAQKAAMRFVLSANYGTAPVQTLNVQLYTVSGSAICAIVEHLDANGNILDQPVALTDPTLLRPSLGTQFALPLNLGNGWDTTLTFSNNSLYPMTATVQAYSPDGLISPDRTPVATVQVMVPPESKMSNLVSALFATSSDFAAFMSLNGGYVNQGYLAVTFDRVTSMGAVEHSTNPDGSLASTVWFAFPADPARPTPPTAFRRPTSGRPISSFGSGILR